MARTGTAWRVSLTVCDIILRASGLWGRHRQSGKGPGLGSESRRAVVFTGLWRLSPAGQGLSQRAQSPGFHPQHRRKQTWWLIPVYNPRPRKCRQEERRFKAILSFTSPCLKNVCKSCAWVTVVWDGKSAIKISHGFLQGSHSLCGAPPYPKCAWGW